jgi:hypothetical protein
MEEATAMNEQEEFEFRMRAEREAATPQATPDPGLGNVMMNALPKGVANLVNTPVTLWNLAKEAAGAVHPQIKDYMPPPTPNYPMQFAEQMGLVDPAKNPQTSGQRIADAAVQGGIGALAGPGGAIKNAATGMAGGMAGQVAGEVGGDKAGLIAGAAAPFALRSYTSPSNLNPQALATAQAGRKAGYVVPPSELKPSFFNEKLESLAGKAATAQEANLRNAKVSEVLANKYLSTKDMPVPDDTPVTREILRGRREKFGEKFQEAADLRPTPEMEWFPRYHETDLVKQSSQARADANKIRANRQYDPSDRDRIEALISKADSIEGDIARLAEANGKPELAKALADARVNIAKHHTVEDALNYGDAGISAPVIARMLNQGKPLGKELELIGKYHEAFPRFMREGSKVPSPGVSGTDAAMSAGLGLGGYGAAGPVGIAAAGLPLVRGPARALALSDWNQNRLLKSAVPPEGLGDTAMRSALIAEILAARQQQGVQ